MKTVLLHIFIIAGAILCSCSPIPRKDFRALDEAIEHQDVYDERFEQNQERLRESYLNATNDSARWEAAYLLEDSYFIHDLDSCIHYIQEMQRLQDGGTRQSIITTSRYAQTLYRLDSLDKALQMVEAFDIPILEKADRETRIAYCRSAYQIFRDAHMREKFNEVIDLWWQTDSTNSGAIFNRDRDLRRNKEFDKAIANIQKSVCRSQRDSAVFYYYLAQLNMARGDNSQAIRYYAKSAEYDMYVSGKNYESLQHLSRQLFSYGDIRRAERYMRIAMTDAEASNWKTRYNHLQDSEFVILNALLAQETQKRRTILVAMVAVVILLVISALLLLYITRQSRKLSLTAKKLQEVSDIKNGFLARYMETSVDYLNKVDEYRSTLRSTMKNDGVDAMKAMLRKPSFASGEYTSLLQEFDSTFLAIFPDFVDKVNGIMKEEFRLVQPAPDTLSTELRILALIKMGIPRRQKIAKILNMSVDTVYVYHSNLQKRSLCPGHTFDKVIAGL